MEAKQKVHVKKGDTVQIMTGNSKGHKGKVLAVSPGEGKVIVEGGAIVKKHVKPRKQGQQGGIVGAESAIYAGKVMPVCPKCQKPTRVGHGTDKSGNKTRVCKKCGAQF